MKKILFYLFFAIIVISCEKDLVQETPHVNADLYEKIHDPFYISSINPLIQSSQEVQNRSTDEEVVALLMDEMENKDKRNNYLRSFTNRFGYPIWEHITIVRENDEEQIAVIPYAKEASEQITTLLFASFDEDQIIFDYVHPDRLDHHYKKALDGNKEWSNIDVSVLGYFMKDFQVFELYHIEYENYLLNNGKETNTAKVRCDGGLVCYTFSAGNKANEHFDVQLREMITVCESYDLCEDPTSTDCQYCGGSDTGGASSGGSSGSSDSGSGVTGSNNDADIIDLLNESDPSLVKLALSSLVFPNQSEYEKLVLYIEAIKNACYNRCFSFGEYGDFFQNWLDELNSGASISIGEVYDVALFALKVKDLIIIDQLKFFVDEAITILEIAAWEYDLAVTKRIFGAIPSYSSKFAINLIKESTQNTLKSFLRFEYAAKFGIQKFDDLVRAFDELGWTRSSKGVHFHHLIEQRFKDVDNIGTWLGSTNTNKWNSIVLTPTEHQIFTNKWLELIPRSNMAPGPLNVNTANATVAHIKEAAKIVYKDHPAILSALGL